jgi:hypothetical protein
MHSKELMQHKLKNSCRISERIRLDTEIKKDIVDVNFDLGG